MQRLKNVLEIDFREGIIVVVRLLSEQAGGGHEIATRLTSPQRRTEGWIELNGARLHESSDKRIYTFQPGLFESILLVPVPTSS